MLVLKSLRITDVEDAGQHGEGGIDLKSQPSSQQLQEYIILFHMSFLTFVPHTFIIFAS